MTNKTAYKILAARMDARENAINEAKKLVKEGKELPDKYKHLVQFFDEKPWRLSLKTVRIVQLAARKAAKNDKFIEENK